MKKLSYTVRFLTPAFLGNAEQSGQWRTPPFKHLLREWWRVAYAAEKNFNVDIQQMRREEGELFGNAWLSHQEGQRTMNDYSKSLVRMRLERWDEGKLKSWQGLEQGTVDHPEVRRTGFKVGPHAYLGYGPLDGRGNTKLSEKINAAIQAGESSAWSLAYPSKNAALIERALWLAHQYGALGGRSRNGWGSFSLLSLPSGQGWGEGQTPPLRDWKDCLDHDWPHAIGRDGKGALIWQTAPHDDWKALMKTLAIVKIGLRTQLQFRLVLNAQVGDKPGKRGGIDHGQPQYRHWLSYPVTNHSVRPWEAEFIQDRRVPLNLRLPNQLRFKVRRTADGKLVGVIFHMPHLPPPTFRPDRKVIESVWQQVHEFLDKPAQKLSRIGA